MTRDETVIATIRQHPPTLGMTIWARRLWLLLFAVLGVLIALPSVLQRKSTYTATATLLFPASPLSGLSAFTGGGGGNDLPSIPLLNGLFMIPQPGTSPNTAIMLLRSWSVDDEIIAKENLAAVWKMDPSDPDAIHAEFNRRLLLRPGKTGDLEIKFSDVSKARALRVVQLLINALQERTTSLGLDPAQRSFHFLNKQVTASEASLKAAMAKLATYQVEHKLIAADKQAEGMAEQYIAVQRDFQQVKLAAGLALQRAEMFSQQSKALIHACIDPGALGVGGAKGDQLNALYQQVTKQESDLLLLKDKYAPESQEITDAEHTLAQSKQLLMREVNRQLRLVDAGDAPMLGQVVSEAALKHSEADALQRMLDRLTPQMKKLPSKMIGYNTLLFEVTAQTNKVKLLREELEKARIVAQNRGSSFVVLEKPRALAKQNARHRLRILLIGLFAGAALVLGYSYLKWEHALAEYHDWLDEQRMSAVQGASTI